MMASCCRSGAWILSLVLMALGAITALAQTSTVVTIKVNFNSLNPPFTKLQRAQFGSAFKLGFSHAVGIAQCIEPTPVVNQKITYTADSLAATIVFTYPLTPAWYNGTALVVQVPGTWIPSQLDPTRKYTTDLNAFLGNDGGITQSSCNPALVVPPTVPTCPPPPASSPPPPPVYAPSPPVYTGRRKMIVQPVIQQQQRAAGGVSYSELQPLDVAYGLDNVRFEVFHETVNFFEAAAICLSRYARLATYDVQETQMLVDILCDPHFGMSCWVQDAIADGRCSVVENSVVTRTPCAARKHFVCMDAK